MRKLHRAVAVVLATGSLAAVGLASSGASATVAQPTTCNQTVAQLLGPLRGLCH